MLDARCLILDTGYLMLDTGYLMLDTGYLMLDTGYLMLDAGSLMLVAGCSILDAGYRKLHVPKYSNAAKILYRRVGCAHQLALNLNVEGGHSPPYNKIPKVCYG